MRVSLSEIGGGGEALLDEIDRTILWEIDLDARVSVTELGHRLQLSKQAISYRLQKLSTNGFILSQIAVIDIHRLGLLTYRLYLRLTSISAKASEKFIDHLVNHSYSLFVGTFSGNWDVEVVFTARNFIHFGEMFKELRAQFGEILYRYDISMTPAVHVFRRDYLVKRPRKSAPLRTYGGEPSNQSFDDLDFHILEALSIDSRLSYDEIAQRLGTSGNTVKLRIKRLTEAEIIKGYRTNTNATLLGRQYVKALLKLAPLKPKEEKAFYAACAKSACVQYLTDVLGSWQLEIEAEVEHPSELDAVLTTLRSEFPGVILDFEMLVMTKEWKLNYLPPGKTAKEIIRP